MKNGLITWGFWFITLLSFTSVSGQTDTTKIKQEVQVIKEYQPSISDAFKINDIPTIKEEKQDKPDFDYSIYSRPVFNNFDVKPVQAAKITEQTDETLASGMLKLGIGNYLTPYGELFYNVLPDSKSNFGMHFKHRSSSGKIKLVNDDRVDAPESENVVELYGSKFFRKSVLSTSLAYQRKAFRYYGYVGNRLSDSEKQTIIPYWQDQQAFSTGTLKLRLKSDRYSRSDVKYNLGLDYHFFGSKTGQQEHLAVLSANLNKDFNHVKGLLDASLTYYRADSVWNNDIGKFGFRQRIILKASPSLMWENDRSMIQIGVNSYSVIDDDADATVSLSPKVTAEWSPVEGVLTLFAKADGYLRHNFYSSIADENPYVDPFHDVKSANYKYVLSGGLKGKLNSKTNYVTGISYSNIKDEHFYVIKSQNLFSGDASLRILSNTLNWYYDDMKLLCLSAEIYHIASENFSFRAKGNYYWYDLKTLSNPSHLPDFDLDISATYQPEGKLSFTTDIFVVGARKAIVEDFITPIPSSSGPGFASTNLYLFKLDPIIDLNMAVNYQYNPALTFFGKWNNFGFQKYEQWVGYANKGFNLLLGASYSF